MYEAREGILSEICTLAAFTSPIRKLAKAFPVVEDEPGRSVISGVNV
jgi:hypothetical protein